MKPIVRHLIACEDIRYGDRPNQFTLVNVTSRIRSLDPVPFPLLFRELCVIALCTECRGEATIQLQVIDEESSEACYQSPRWPVAFGDDPLEVIGLPFRIRNLGFPRAGLYVLRLLHNEQPLAEQPLRLTE
jgi:hypothetical protein